MFDSPAASCLVCGTWLGTLWAHFPIEVTTATGLIAGIYYAILIVKELKEWNKKA